MKFINELKEGDKIKEIYLCKKVATAQTKTGKTYWNVTLQDKTGTVDGKVWDRIHRVSMTLRKEIISGFAVR